MAWKRSRVQVPYGPLIKNNPIGVIFVSMFVEAALVRGDIGAESENETST